MTQENSPSGEGSKARSLKSLLLSNPVAEIETSAGRIYLYGLRMRDVRAFGKLEPGDAKSQFKAFLPCIGSLIAESDDAPERVPLDAAIVAGISDDEIERIADAYAKTFQPQNSRDDLQGERPVVQENGEAATAFVMRLIKAEIERQRQSTKRSLEDMRRSNLSMFDRVRESAFALGSTLEAYKELTKPAKKTLELHPDQIGYSDRAFNHIAEQARKQAKERAEEMEMTRLIGRMTAESAKTLKELAEAATTLMEQMNERDQRANQFTHKQITIAVWSVGISAVLALLALIVSGFAYVQDKDNSASNEQWQMKLLATIDQGNQQRLAVERENEVLREQVKSLSSRVTSLEASQLVVTETGKVVSVKQRKTKAATTPLLP